MDLTVCSERLPGIASLGKHKSIFRMLFPRFASVVWHPGAELLPWAGAPSSCTRVAGTRPEGAALPDGEVFCRR